MLVQVDVVGWETAHARCAGIAEMAEMAGHSRLGAVGRIPLTNGRARHNQTFSHGARRTTD